MECQPGSCLPVGGNRAAGASQRRRTDGEAAEHAPQHAAGAAAGELVDEDELVEVVHLAQLLGRLAHVRLGVAATAAGRRVRSQDAEPGAGPGVAQAGQPSRLAFSRWPNVKMHVLSMHMIFSRPDPPVIAI